MRYGVSEIFASVQGEGLNTGRPATFVRLSGCNLRCSWCDTDHKLSRTLTEEEIVTETIQKSLARWGASSLVVISGGEPTIYDLAPLVGAFDKSFKLALETNGTGRVPGGLSFLAVSPKIPGSMVKNLQAEQVEAKVIVEPENLQRTKALVEECCQWGFRTIWLQPESNRAGALEEAKKLLNYAPDILRIGHQMHKIRGWP